MCKSGNFHLIAATTTKKTTVGLNIVTLFRDFEINIQCLYSMLNYIKTALAVSFGFIEDLLVFGPKQ